MGFLAHEDRNQLCVQWPCAESTLHHFRLTVKTPSQKKLTLIHTKATLQPYRTTATLTDTELQPDGEDTTRTELLIDASRGRFRRRRSNRVQPTSMSVALSFFVYHSDGSLVVPPVLAGLILSKVVATCMSTFVSFLQRVAGLRRVKDACPSFSPGRRPDNLPSELAPAERCRARFLSLHSREREAACTSYRW